LRVEREGGAPSERIVVFDGDVCRIGSHASNDLALADPTVSRFHCRLTREASVWRITDTGSLNGTRLGGVRIRDAELEGKDGLLALGDSLVRVEPAAAERRSILPSAPAFGSLVGTSRPMRRLFGVMEKVAPSDINVLIHGESGTGKELVATELVQRSPRCDKPFVVVDCGSIASNLVESELFGHAKGAFTGADRERVGAFEAADGGTVFLDEIGELPLELQPKLLRALEAREIRRLGETRARKVNVRVVSATHRDLEREVNKGRFREDLYFRLAVVTVEVPPLRERLDDLPLLIEGFLRALHLESQQSLFEGAVLDELTRHDWPGNVRELRNYVERSVVLQSAALGSKRSGSGATAQAGSSASHGGGGSGPLGGIDTKVPFKVAKDQLIEEFERAYLAQLLSECGQNMSRAARTAGVDRMYLHRLVQKHGLRGGGLKGNE
jgi:transcriptional regulator with GAF, ATPase, and Fis domain